jgi:hypothetical protein
MSLVVLFLELFGCFVELNLAGLGGCDFLVELLLLSGNFQSQLFNLKIQFSDFGVIFLSILLENDIIFFLLLACDGPLLQLFLIPVKLQLNLLNFLIRPENSDLNVIESLLIFCNDFVVFLDFILESAALSLGHLPHVILSLGLLVLLVDKALGIEELLIDISQMFF